MTVGVPPEAVAMILCIDPIAAMFNAVSNTSMNITSTFIVANSLNFVDKEIYSAD
ncbi:MAG: hypothetical protein IJ685_08485 [Selenomonadaceae bacterium]|nr:hypothetical protein [Selenomonadaceae bacterium]